MTLDATLERAAEEIDLLNQPEVISELVRWQRKPSAWCGGRTGWLLLDSAATGRGACIRALKLKGIGGPVVENGYVTAAPPSTEQYIRWPGVGEDPHFGIDKSGFCWVAGDPAPLRGITLSAALREFDAAAGLRTAGVPALVPLAVYRYPGLSFGPTCAPMGVVVTGSPERSPLRVGAVLDGLGDPSQDVYYLTRLSTALHAPPTGDPIANALSLLEAATRRYGNTLRRFSEAGYFRYSGHIDNYGIDPGTGEAFLIDLDSSRELEELPPALQFSQVARDAMSALYNLACAFFRPDQLELLPDSALADGAVFSAFFDGWAPEVHIDPEILATFAEYVIGHRSRLRRYSTFLLDPHPTGAELYRYVRHDTEVTTVALYRLCSEVLHRSTIAVPAPSMVPGPALDEALVRFCGHHRVSTASRAVPVNLLDR